MAYFFMPSLFMPVVPLFVEPLSMSPLHEGQRFLASALSRESTPYLSAAWPAAPAP
jgi:hypothetical protein